MSGEASDISELVIDALEKAIQQDGECLLSARGRGQPGLLPGGRQTVAKELAQKQCLDPKRGLFNHREVVEGKGKSIGSVHFVTVAPRGIEVLFASRAAGDRLKLLDKCANPHKELAHEAFLRLAEKDLALVNAERDRLCERESELLKLVTRLVADQSSSIRRQREELDNQLAELKAVAGHASESRRPEPPIDRRQSGGGSAPRTEAEAEFQLHVARELVFAWQDSPDPEARSALERVMFNAGLEMVGEVGEVVSFDNRNHQTDDNLLPDQPAEVVEPGWQLVTPRGEVQIDRARVRKGVNNAAHA